MTAKKHVSISLAITKRCNRYCNHCMISAVDKDSPYLSVSDI